MEPKTSLEHTMRNEVRALRQQEERSALGRMRDWQGHASRHVDSRMKRYKDRTLDEISDFGDHVEDKIAHEEKAEERGGVSKNRHPHEKNHGIRREMNRLEQEIGRLRDKEARHVQHDMKEGYQQKEANAVMGMRENQAKDENQIIGLTRRLSKKSFAKGAESMKVKDKKKKTVVGINPRATDSFPGYGTAANRPSELTRSMSAAEQMTPWQYVLARATGLTPAISSFYEPAPLLPEAINAEFQADVFYKTLGVHEDYTRENIARSIFNSKFIDYLLKGRVTRGVDSATGVSVPSSARVAPWLNSRAHIKQVATDAGLWHNQTQGLHNGGRVQMSGGEWEENARVAHNKGQGWLHAYSGDGTFGPTNQAWHDAYGTKGRDTVALSVGDPFKKGSRTVMIGVRIPTDMTGKNYMVQHLIWHNNRYIPVNGVDHHGNAIQQDDNYNTNKKGRKDVGNWNNHGTGTGNNYYESKAMQHICEHAALHLPGHVFTEPQGGRTAFVDDHKALPTVTFGARRAGVKELIDHINSTSTANNWTFPRRAGQVAKSDNSVGRHISTIRGVKHGSYEPDSNITDADARTSANTLQDTMNDNVVRGMRQFGAGHKAYRAAGQALPPGPVLHLAHQGSDASFSDIDLHSDLEHN